MDALLHNLTSAPGFSSIVSEARLKATVALSLMALNLPLCNFVETGVFTGSTAAIMMRALMAYKKLNPARPPCQLYAFDSFEGLPPGTKEDGGFDQAGPSGILNSSQEVFERNLKKWSAWDDSLIVVTKGWFKDTLPVIGPDIGRISFLRLDGDLFVSTYDPLVYLYKRVIPGGIIYVDDYGSFRGCRKAVDKFREISRIWEPLHYVDESVALQTSELGSHPPLRFEAVWWRKRGGLTI